MNGNPSRGMSGLHPAVAEFLKDSRSGWYAVRCLFQSNWPPDEPEAATRHYEERITLWRADSSDHAIELAEAEAEEYAGSIEDAPSVYLGLAQAYAMEEVPGQGCEVFSLIRDSELEPDAYLDAFFDDGRERQGHGD
ncbi:MAG TPA: hypothetical protein VIP98_06385 [Microlunatus sp.]